MPEARPSGALWDAVVAKLGKDPWPLDEEVTAKALGDRWKTVRDVYVNGSRDTYKLADQVTEAWPDTAGRATRDSMVQLVEQLEVVGHQMSSRGASATHYAGVLKTTKSNIGSLIRINTPIYQTYLDSPDKAQLEGRRVEFVDTVADEVDKIVAAAFKAVNEPETSVPVQSVVRPGDNSVANVLERVNDLTSRGQPIPPELRQELTDSLALLNEVNNQAAAGQPLPPAQLNFLDQTLGRLDRGIFGLPEAFDRNLAQQPAADAKSILGNSILALSNEKLGGSPLSQGTPLQPVYGLPPVLYDMVVKPGNPVHKPEPVINPYSDGSLTSYALPNESDWKNLSALFGKPAASDVLPVAGGTEFSQALTRKTADIAAASMEASQNSLADARFGIGLLNGSQHNELSGVLENLLDGSTRNADANLAVLTAPDGSQVTNTLWTMDWTDDGRAATGLTGWIDDYKNSGDPGKIAMADQGAQSVFRTSSDPTTFAHLVDLDGPNSESLGQRNPLIAQDLGRTIVPYFDDFSRQPGTAHPGLSIGDDESRTRIFQLASTDPGSAKGLSAALQIHQQQAGQQIAAHPELAHGLGDRQSRLTGYFEQGVRNDAFDRGADANAELANTKREGIAVLKTAVAVAGLPNIPAAAASVIAGGAFDYAVNPLAPQQPLPGNNVDLGNLGAGSRANITYGWAVEGLQRQGVDVSTLQTPAQLAIDQGMSTADIIGYYENLGKSHNLDRESLRVVAEWYAQNQGYTNRHDLESYIREYENDTGQGAPIVPARPR